MPCREFDDNAITFIQTSSFSNLQALKTLCDSSFLAEEIIIAVIYHDRGLSNNFIYELQPGVFAGLANLIALFVQPSDLHDSVSLTMLPQRLKLQQHLVDITGYIR